MVRSPSEENLLPLFLGQLSTTCSNATEVAVFGNYVSCCRQQWCQRRYNGVRDGSSNYLDVTQILYKALPHERHLHSANPCSLSWESNPQHSDYDSTALIAYAVPLGLFGQESSAVCIINFHAHRNLPKNILIKNCSLNGH